MINMSTIERKNPKNKHTKQLNLKTNQEQITNYEDNHDQFTFDYLLLTIDYNSVNDKVIYIKI